MKTNKKHTKKSTDSDISGIIQNSKAIADAANMQASEGKAFALSHTPSDLPISDSVIDNVIHDVTDILTESELNHAKSLQVKFPSVVAAAKAVFSQEQVMARKYFTLADSLRGTGLNGREMHLLLASLGYRKQRITEIKKAISVSDDVWAKYKDNVIGFKAVLQIARAPAKSSASAQGSDIDTDSNSESETSAGEKEERSGGRKTNIVSIPDSVRENLIEPFYATIEGGTMPVLESGYYQTEYRASYTDSDGQIRTRKFLISVEISDSISK